jgi:hypothetical protein
MSPHQQIGFDGKGAVRRQPSADASADEQPELPQPAGVRTAPRQRLEQDAEQDRPEQVRDQGAAWKSGAGRKPLAEPVSGRRADRAADANDADESSRTRTEVRIGRELGM